MKNNLEAGSGKSRQTCQAFFASFTPGRVLVGIGSFLLLLLSLLGTIVTPTRTDVIAAGAHSVAKHSLAPADTSTSKATPTLTPTRTSSPTSTPSPTATPTMLPTPTSTSKPSPIATSRPSPTAISKPSPTATMIPTALPTSSTSLTPSISPTQASKHVVAKATPDPTSIVPTASPQTLVQCQTPTTTSRPQTSQEQQNKTFPFMALAIGIPGIVATLVFLFIGWWLLRKRLLPQSIVKLPPSGASPWSRVRPNDAVLTDVNSALPLAANNAQLTFSNGQMPLRSNGMTSFDANSAPPAINIDPTLNGNVEHHPANEMNQIRTARLLPLPDDFSETNIPPIVSENSNNANDEDTYGQWLQNNNARDPNLNDPYLKELIKQFSDKTRAAQHQNVTNFGNEQAD